MWAKIKKKNLLVGAVISQVHQFFSLEGCVFWVCFCSDKCNNKCKGKTTCMYIYKMGNFTIRTLLFIQRSYRRATWWMPRISDPNIGEVISTLKQRQCSCQNVHCLDYTNPQYKLDKRDNSDQCDVSSHKTFPMQRVSSERLHHAKAPCELDVLVFQSVCSCECVFVCVLANIGQDSSGINNSSDLLRALSFMDGPLNKRNCPQFLWEKKIILHVIRVSWRWWR